MQSFSKTPTNPWEVITMLIMLNQIALLSSFVRTVGKPELRCLFVADCLQLAAVLLLGGSPCLAAESPVSPPPEQAQAKRETASPSQSPSAVGKDGNIWIRPTLTGDWFGLRSKMEDSGVTFSGRGTHFGFGIVGGINRPVPAPLGQGDAFDYTGRGEYDLTFDLDKLVGLPHGSLLVRAEHWFGQFGNVSLRTGTNPPAVFPTVLPPVADEPGVPMLTSFFYTQPLSRQLVLFFGKREMVGAFDQDIFAGGDGTSHFVNQGFIGSPTYLDALPYSTVAMGAASPQDWGRATIQVFDAKERSNEFMDLGTLFSKGLYVQGEVRVDTHFFDLPGEHHIGFVYKHLVRTLPVAGPAPPGELPPASLQGTGTRHDSYTLYYGFDQYLFHYGEDSKRGWGIFGRAAIGDPSPSPLGSFVSFGIGGNSPFGRERGDTFGIGWYFAGVSSSVSPGQRLLLGQGSGNAVEVFYNIQVTPWLNVTPDFQYLTPNASRIANDSFLFGLRLNTQL